MREQTRGSDGRSGGSVGAGGASGVVLGVFACQSDADEPRSRSQVRRRGGEGRSGRRGRDGPDGADRQQLRARADFVGFDTHTYPGTADDEGVEEHAGLAVQVGRLLSAVALSRRQFVDRQARHAAAMGWGVAIVYVGQQTWGKTPRDAHVRAARRASQEERLLGRSDQRRRRDVLNADDATAACGGGRVSDRAPSCFSTSSACENIPPAMRDYYKRVDRAHARDQASISRASTRISTTREQIFTDVKDVFKAAGDTTTPRFWIAGGKDFDEGQRAAGRRLCVRRRVAGRDRRRAVGGEHPAAGRRQRRVVDVAVGVGSDDDARRAAIAPIVPRAGRVHPDTFATRPTRREDFDETTRARGAARCGAVACAGFDRRPRTRWRGGGGAWRRLEWTDGHRSRAPALREQGSRRIFAAAATVRAQIARQEEDGQHYAAKARPGNTSFRRSSTRAAPTGSRSRRISSRRSTRGPRSTPRSCGCTAACTATGTRACVRSSSRRCSAATSSSRRTIAAAPATATSAIARSTTAARKSTTCSRPSTICHAPVRRHDAARHHGMEPRRIHHVAHPLPRRQSVQGGRGDRAGDEPRLPVCPTTARLRARLRGRGGNSGPAVRAQLRSAARPQTASTSTSSARRSFTPRT